MKPGFNHKGAAGSLIVLSVLLLTGCGESPAEPKPTPAVAQAPLTTPKAQKRVESIVFVGQKQACECTRTRIDTSWQVLQNVLKDSPDVPVKRIQRDVDAEATEKLSKLKPCMVAPGIYFLDQKSGLVELLQGEVREDQIAALLQ
jgi:hypothetical protein